jgi:hypothetical protein
VNEYEIDDVVAHFGKDKQEIPNLFAAALALSRLRGWTNSHSDGWQYWSKPSTAATQLITVVKEGERQYRKTWEWQDITEAQLKKALTPVKSFLTRQKQDWREVLEPPPPVDRARQIKAAVWEEGWQHYSEHSNPLDPEFGKNPYLDG